MIWSFVYLAVGRAMALVLLCVRSSDAEEVELLVLRHEREILRRARQSRSFCTVVFDTT